MLLGLGALLIMPVLAGCHDTQNDFANMSKDQQMKAANTSTPATVAAANKAMQQALSHTPTGTSNAPGPAASTAAPK